MKSRPPVKAPGDSPVALGLGAIRHLNRQRVRMDCAYSARGLAKKYGSRWDAIGKHWWVWSDIAEDLAAVMKAKGWYCEIRG